MIRNYGDLTRLEMESVDKENTIVLIPIGALEQHGNQCPLATDDIIAEGIIKRLQRKLPEEFPMLLFPLLPIGLSTEHRNFCGSIALKPDTLYHMLHDICVSLHHHGFQKICFLISHGGNVPLLQILSREMRSELGLSIFLINCGAFFGNKAVMDTVSKGNRYDFHGGEMETSMVLAEKPETVKLETAKTGKPKGYEGNKMLTVYGPITIGWLSEEWVDEEGVPIGIGGDPSGATAEKGEQIYESFVESIMAGLEEIRNFSGHI